MIKLLRVTSGITSLGLRYLASCTSIFLEKAVIKYLSSVIIELEGNKYAPPLESSQIYTTRVLTEVTENFSEFVRPYCL